MSANPFGTLNVLVVDDFNSFRITLNKIMYELGFKNVDSVGTGEEALSLCEKNHYDLILCDYNLGQGKNGQQFLEDLRVSKLLKSQDIFILLSAETSRNVVMSAYDCEPDAYLTKPITTKVIQQRLKRLLNKRNEMLSIYESLGKSDIAEAIRLLKRSVDENSRHSMDCQKLLGELYLQESSFDEAEAIYRTVLEMRALDWAQVGLAKVKVAKGEPEKAVQWLNDIIEENPSCMKAYDALSSALEATNDRDALQQNLEKAVEISPMSIGRQVSLAKTALENGDAEVAAKAFRKTVKHGANSCHDTVENQLNYAKAVARFYDNDALKAGEMAKEAIKILNELEEKQVIDPELQTQSKLLGSQLWAIKGDNKKSKEILDIVADSLEDQVSVDIDIEIEMVNTLISNNEFDRSQLQLKRMIEKYKNDEAALEKIDPLLSEPVSEKGKKILAKVNKKGIEAYKAAEYDVAINYFIKVEKRYPRYLGIKLNLAQAIISQLRQNGIDEASISRCVTIFDVVSRYITADNAQFKRYRQLQDMLRAITSPTQEQS
ncbi:MAG: response regulator [Cellvibrionaceae bacterium]